MPHRQCTYTNGSPAPPFHAYCRRQVLAAGFDHSDALYVTNIAANDGFTMNAEWMAAGATGFIDRVLASANPRPIFQQVRAAAAAAG